MTFSSHFAITKDLRRRLARGFSATALKLFTAKVFSFSRLLVKTSRVRCCSSESYSALIRAKVPKKHKFFILPMPFFGFPLSRFVIKYPKSSQISGMVKIKILPRETLEVKHNLPIARKSSLIVKELPTETLVYDLETDKAHCLNETVARVWKNCDGNRDVAELRALMEKETKLPVPEDMVWLALDQLEKFKLLEGAPAKSFSFSGMNRREVVKRIGISALALPLIISIVAPTAKAQASVCRQEPAVTIPNHCQSNNCAQGGPCGSAAEHQVVCPISLRSGSRVAQSLIRSNRRTTI